VLEIHRYLANSLNFTDTFALEILVSQIAATLRNALLFEELETAKEEAEIANRLKSQFLASMSHSLRNPLNAILHWLEFMINGFMGKLNAEQISVLKMMVSNGEHLLGLLNDGLDISRVKIGQGELFVEPLDITSILYNARSVLLDYVRKKPIRVIMEIERDIPEIHGDQRRLNQIFLYLATYSARSITDGTVTMRAYHEAGSVFASINTLGNSVSLHHATDKPKDVEHRNTPYGDSRFSLPITKYFIALHGGRIWFERENETNITYYIQLKGIVEDAPQTADNN
jgi:signal transduction histidine kinase